MALLSCLPALPVPAVLQLACCLQNMPPPRTHILISGSALGHPDQMEPLPVLWQTLWT